MRFKCLVLVGVVAAWFCAAVACLADGSASATPIRFLPLGDSITAQGYYIVPLLNNLNGNGYSASMIANEGHGGYIIDGSIVGAPRAGLRENINSFLNHPDVNSDTSYILLMIGTNDVDTGFQLDSAQVQSRMGGLISSITTIAPLAHLIVAEIVPNLRSSAADQAVQRFNDDVVASVITAASTGQNVTLVDMYAPMQPNPSIYMGDALHPNGAGGTLMAGVWYDGIVAANQGTSTTQWKLAGGGSWNAAANWSTGAVPQGAGALVSFAGNITGPSVVTVDAPVTAGILRINNTSAGYTLAGPEAITLQSSAGNAAIQNYGGVHTISAPLVLATNTNASVGRAADALTLSGGIGEAVAGRSLNKIGPGVLVLTAEGSYSGGTNISQGSLWANNVSGSATGSGTVAVASGAKLAGSGLIAGPVVNNGTIAPGGIWTPGALRLGGGLTLNPGGTLALRIGTAASDSIDLGGTGLLNATGVTTLALSDAGMTGEGSVVVLRDYAAGSSFNTGNFSLPLKSMGYFASLVSDPAARTLSIRLDANNSKLWVGPTEPLGSRQPSSAPLDVGRVMKGTMATAAFSLHSSGSHAAISDAALASTGDVYTATASLANFGTLSSSTVILRTMTTGAKTGQVTVTNSATNSHDVGMGSDNGTATLNVTGTVLDNRAITAAWVNLGVAHVGATVANSITLVTASGDDQHATRVRVGNPGPDGWGIGISGGANPVFNDNTVSDVRTIGGTVVTVGSSTNTITLPVTGESLSGESPMNVSVRYSVQVYSGQAVWNHGSGSWGAHEKWIDSAPGGPNVGAPGIAGFAGDTATFGSFIGSVNASISLDGQNPRLASMRFDNTAGGQYSIVQGSGAGAITLDNGLLFPAITNANGTHTVEVPIVLAGDLNASVVHADDVLTLHGPISGAKRLNLAGDGTLALGGAADLAGATVSSGTLQLGDGGSGGDLSWNIVNHGAVVFNRGDAWTYGGVITGTGQVVQNGGTTRLTGASSYSGPTQIIWGTLLLDGSLTGGGDGIAVHGTLGGRGTTTRTVSVESDGTIAPGDDTIGTLHVGSTRFSDFGALAIKLSPDGAGDCLDIAGTLDLSSSWDVLALNTLDGTFSDHRYTLARFSAGTLDAQTFNWVTVNGMPIDGRILPLGGVPYELEYTNNAGGGGTIDLVPVPEPSTLALLAGGIAGLGAVVLRRRTNRRRR